MELTCSARNYWRYPKVVQGRNGSNIIMIQDTNKIPRNLISKYMRLAVDDIGKYNMTYIVQQTRQAQNSNYMYHYISNSITKSSHLKIVAELHKYTVQGPPMGDILFKILMKKSAIDTRATGYHLRENLKNEISPFILLEPFRW